jgi:hypothetical protein
VHSLGEEIPYLHVAVQHLLLSRRILRLAIQLIESLRSVAEFVALQQRFVRDQNGHSHAGQPPTGRPIQPRTAVQMLSAFDQYIEQHRLKVSGGELIATEGLSEGSRRGPVHLAGANRSHDRLRSAGHTNGELTQQERLS